MSVPDSQSLANSPGEPHDSAYIPHLSGQTVVSPIRAGIGPIRQMYRLLRAERLIQGFRDKRHKGREETRGGVEGQVEHLVARRLRRTAPTTPSLRTGEP